MPLNEDSLTQRIINYRIQMRGGEQPRDRKELERDSRAIAKAVIEEIKQNAAVLVTGVQSGVSTAPGTVS
jgi:hypothetical protein